ncbi:MAG: DNA-directed RNA polymerase subunit beta, partial [Eubacteriales bacterium]|nr:DNA-directed RNA polymerase subunit beta [Eubacteriales bacterium]
MVKTCYLGTRERKSFSKNEEVIEMPNLIEVQKKSFRDFVEHGVKEVLDDFSPMTDYSGNLVIDFVGYNLNSAPKYTIMECKERDVNYAVPFKVRVRLTNKVTEEVKEQEIYMGDFPIMTESGTFIINGAERVIVSQIVRSPGVYYDKIIDKTGKHLFSSTIIPYRGAWLEYETDTSDVFYVRIDKNRKLPITVLLRALGLSENKDIIDLFGGKEKLINATLEKDLMAQEAEKYPGSSPRDEALKEIFRKLRPGDPPVVDSAITLLKNLFFDPKRYDISPVGRYKFNKKLSLVRRIEGHALVNPVADPLTGEILFDKGHKLNRNDAEKIEKAGICSVVISVEEDEQFSEVKVFSNRMVDASAICGYTNEELGVDEKVQVDVLFEILRNVGRDDLKELKKAIAAEIDRLIPKSITVDDIYASVNYIINLYHGIGI